MLWIYVQEWHNRKDTFCLRDLYFDTMWFLLDLSRTKNKELKTWYLEERCFVIGLRQYFLAIQLNFSIRLEIQSGTKHGIRRYCITKLKWTWLSNFKKMLYIWIIIEKHPNDHVNNISSQWKYWDFYISFGGFDIITTNLIQMVTKREYNQNNKKG